MVVAEKLVTALQRGRASTRWRDFADLFMLVPGDLAEDEIIEALRAVAKYRGVPLQPLGQVLDGMDKEVRCSLPPRSTPSSVPHCRQRAPPVGGGDKDESPDREGRGRAKGGRSEGSGRPPAGCTV